MDYIFPTEDPVLFWLELVTFVVFLAVVPACRLYARARARARGQVVETRDI